MIRETIKALVPPALRRLVPSRARRFLRGGRPPVPLVSLDRAAPGHVRRHAIPAEHILTPEAIHMIPWTPAASLLRQSTFCTPEIFTTELQGALYEPANSVVLTPSRAVVTETLGAPRVDHPFERAAIYADEVRPVSGYCTPLRFFRTNHYHTLIDALPRLYLLNAEPFAALPEIKLLHTGTLSPMERLFVEKMCPENVRPTRVEEGCLYEVEHYLLASFLSRPISGYLPAPYLRAFRRAMLPQRPPRRDRRIFVSRQHAARRVMKNYDEARACMERFGFREHVLEDLTVQEQIELFYDAEMVVATHGAGLTNLLFAGAPACVVEIFSTAYVLPHYYYLCKALGHTYHYLYGAETSREVDFEVNVRQLAATVEQAVAAWQHQTGQHQGLSSLARGARGGSGWPKRASA